MKLPVFANNGTKDTIRYDEVLLFSVNSLLCTHTVWCLYVCIAYIHPSRTASVCVCIVFIFTEQIWLQHTKSTAGPTLFSLFHALVARFSFLKYCWLADLGFVDWDSVCVAFVACLSAAFGAASAWLRHFLWSLASHAHLSNYLCDFIPIDLCTLAALAVTANGRGAGSIANQFIDYSRFHGARRGFLKCKYAKLTGFHKLESETGMVSRNQMREL